MPEADSRREVVEVDTFESGKLKKEQQEQTLSKLIFGWM